MHKSASILQSSDQGRRTRRGGTGGTPHLSIKGLVRLREGALHRLLSVSRRLLQLPLQRHHFPLSSRRSPLCGSPIQLGSLELGLRVLKVRIDAACVRENTSLSVFWLPRMISTFRSEY